MCGQFYPSLTSINACTHLTLEHTKKIHGRCWSCMKDGMCEEEEPEVVDKKGERVLLELVLDGIASEPVSAHSDHCPPVGGVLA